MKKKTSHNPWARAKPEPYYITLQYEMILHDTIKAWLVLFDGEEVWIPRSQADIIDETYSLIQLPKWLAEKRHLKHLDIDADPKTYIY